MFWPLGSPHPRETPEQRDHRLGLTEQLTWEIVPLSNSPRAVAALPPSSPVSITCSPVKGIEATQALTDEVRAQGHRAIPHLAARMVDGPGQATAVARWLRTEGIDEIFVVAGDAEHPAGPYPGGADLLADLLDADPGVTRVGVPAYPDGHALIETGVLHQALRAKQDLLAEAGVEAYASTQMCFDPGRIRTWLRAERESGLTLDIHLGLAGAVDRARLMTMGMRLGVGTSLRYLRKNRSALSRLMLTPHYDPNQLLRALSPILHPYGVTGIHCFTFNQVEATARWRRRTLQ